MQFFVTNDHFSDIDEVARCYDPRAGVEPLIGGVGIPPGAEGGVKS